MTKRRRCGTCGLRGHNSKTCTSKVDTPSNAVDYQSETSAPEPPESPKLQADGLKSQNVVQHPSIAIDSTAHIKQLQMETSVSEVQTVAKMPADGLASPSVSTCPSNITGSTANMGHNSDEWQIVQANGDVHDIPMQEVQVNGDGHCLLYAILTSWCLQRNDPPPDYDQVKKMILKEGEQSAEFYIGFYSDRLNRLSADTIKEVYFADLKNYVHRKIYNSSAGDMIPLMVSSALNLKLHIFNVAGVQFQNLCVKGRNQQENLVDVYIMRRGDHYNALDPRRERNDPPASTCVVRKTESASHQNIRSVGPAHVGWETFFKCSNNENASASSSGPQNSNAQKCPLYIDLGCSSEFPSLPNADNRQKEQFSKRKPAVPASQSPSNENASASSWCPQNSKTQKRSLDIDLGCSSEFPSLPNANNRRKEQISKRKTSVSASQSPASTDNTENVSDAINMGPRKSKRKRVVTEIETNKRRDGRQSPVLEFSTAEHSSEYKASDEINKGKRKNKRKRAVTEIKPNKRCDGRQSPVLEFSNTEHHGENIAIEAPLGINVETSTEQQANTRKNNEHGEQSCNDRPRDRKIRKCSNCFQTGHNKQNCRVKKSKSSTGVSTDTVNVVKNLDEGFCVTDGCSASDVNRVDLLDTINSNLTEEFDANSFREETAECACCHRNSSVYELDLRVVDSNYQNRRYGDTRSLTETSLVCVLCYHYTKREGKGLQWCFAWPSVFYTYLTQPGNVSNPAKFVEFLPTSLKKSFSHFKSSYSPQIVQVWQETSPFVDVTKSRNEFLQKENKYLLGILMQILNETAYPTMLCPLGCSQWPWFKLGGKLRLIGGQHYLQSITNFNSFGADKSHFAGVRSDWTTPRLAWGIWLVSPSLYIDDKKGLCVLACGPDVHADGRKQFLHVPRNPVLNDQSPLHPDISAPAVLSPNLVRSGKSNENTTSYVVMKEMGTEKGVSSFGLAVNADRVITTDKSWKALGLSLTHRPEIAEAHLTAGKPWAAKAIQEFSLKKPVSEADVIAAGGTGNYIEVNDAMHQLKAYNSGLQGNDTCSQLKRKHIDCLNIVHPNTSAGRKPFELPQIRSKDDVNSGAVISVVISSLLHCRILHKNLLNNKWNRQEALLKDLVKLIKEIESSKTIKKEKFKLLETKFLEQYSLEDELKSTAAAKILSKVCDLPYHRLQQEDHIEDALTTWHNAVIVDNSDLLEIEGVTSDNGRFKLMFSSRLVCQEEEGEYYELASRFRWTENHCWWTVVGNKTVYSENFGHQPFNMLVWQKEVEDELLSDEFLNMSGGQSKMRCRFHRGYFLMKERPGSGLRCSRVGCVSAIRWRCGKGFMSDYRCCVGLCMRHGKEALDRPSPLIVSVGGEDVVEMCSTLREARQGVEDWESRMEEEIVTENIETDHANDGTLTAFMNMYEEGGLGFLSASHDAMPVVTNATPPDVTTDELFKTSGHFILNDHLRCLNRVHVNRGVPVSFHKLLTYLHSIYPGKSIPTLYVEGLLFPRIFWNSVNKSVVGALPSVMYGEGHQVKCCVANILDHMRVRLLTHDLLTSVDHHYISFAFDVTLNHALRTSSITLALTKGLENIIRSGIKNDESLKFDERDSHVQVNRLAAMNRNSRWDLFLTLTCNDQETFGVYPIRRRIEQLYPKGSKELEDALQNACTVICRAWDRNIEYFIEYLLESDERILGHILYLYCRTEYQSEGSPGNKPHVHIGITLHPGVTKGELVQLVANKPGALFTKSAGTDFESLKERGMVKDYREFCRLIELANILTTHSCDTAGQRCQKRKRDGTMSCRVPSHFASFDYNYVRYRDLYTREFKEILMELGLAQKIGEGKSEYIEVADELVGGRYYYKSDPPNPHTKNIPTNGNIFAAFRSITNLQVTDDRFTGAYLQKYIGGKDEKRRVILTAKKSCNEKNIDIAVEPLFNEKIVRKTAKQSALEKEALAKEVGLPEQISFVLKHPYVRVNVDFVHLCTKPVECRAAVLRQKFNKDKQVGSDGVTPRAVEARKELENWRQFSENQIILIKDYIEGVHHIDALGSFNLRPPELRVVTSVEKYLKWFVRKSSSKFRAVSDLHESEWRDGTWKLVKIRSNHVTDFQNYLEGLGQREGAQEMNVLLSNLQDDLKSGVESDIVSRFVAPAKKEVIVVFSDVTPERMDHFFYHLLITFGALETELDLSSRSYLEAFEYAGLVRSANRVDRRDLVTITRKYLMDQLQYQPVSAGKLSYLTELLMHGLDTLFKNGTVLYQTMPLVTYRAIQEQATNQLAQVEQSRKEILVDALSQHLPGLPNRDRIIAGEATDFVPKITRILGQTEASFTEQNQALNYIKSQIDQLRRPGVMSVMSPLLVGPPGAGKTHVFLMACAYALCRTLRVMMTALTSERARSLGGQHIHALFSFTVSQSKLEAPDIMAERSLQNLASNSTKSSFLKRLDIIFIDEIGLVPGHLLVAMDLVLRRVRGSCVPYGGLLIIASGDHTQLGPVNARTLFLGAQIMSTFAVLMLEGCVRFCLDRDLKRLTSIIRQSRRTQEDINEAIEILRRRCATNFVSSWRDVPSGTLRVVGKKAAEREAVEEYLNEKKTSNVDWREYEALDEIEISSGCYTTAEKNVTKILNYNLAEQEKLLIYKGALMRLTYNDRTQRGHCQQFSQGQLCIVTELPDDNAQRKDQAVTVRLVPAGCRQVDADNIPDSWKMLKVGRRHTVPVIVGSRLTKARREQFPLTYYVCVTVHKLMGDTCNQLATQISSRDRKYALWELKQLLVILTRVGNLSLVTFVGEIEDTLRAIRKLLETADPELEFIDRILKNVNLLKNSSHVIELDGSEPVQVMESCIPSHDCGAVGLLLTMKDKLQYKVMNTHNIRAYVSSVNAGICNAEVHLRPWDLLFFVVGFPGGGCDGQNYRGRQRFVEIWNSVNFESYGNRPLLPSQMFSGAIKAIERYNRENATKITLRQCLKYRTAADPSHPP